MTVNQLLNCFAKQPDEVFYAMDCSLEEATEEGKFVTSTLVHSFGNQYGDYRVIEWKLWNNYNINDQLLGITIESK